MERSQGRGDPRATKLQQAPASWPRGPSVLQTPSLAAGTQPLQALSQCSGGFFSGLLVDSWEEESHLKVPQSPTLGPGSSLRRTHPCSISRTLQLQAPPILLTRCPEALTSQMQRHLRCSVHSSLHLHFLPNNLRKVAQLCESSIQWVHGDPPQSYCQV